MTRTSPSHSTRQASTRRASPSLRGAWSLDTLRAESLEGALIGHQSWALLRRYRCRLLLAEILKGVDRNIWMPLSPSQELAREVTCFGRSTWSQLKWATGDLPEECRFLLNTRLVFLKKEKDPTSKQFDDDEWIRSLTEAQEVTADVAEDRKRLTPKKFGPFRWESSCGSMSRDDFWHSSREKLQSSRHRSGRSEWVPQVALRPWPSFISSSSMNG